MEVRQAVQNIRTRIRDALRLKQALANAKEPATPAPALSRPKRPARKAKLEPEPGKWKRPPKVAVPRRQKA